MMKFFIKCLSALVLLFLVSCVKDETGTDFKYVMPGVYGYLTPIVFEDEPTTKGTADPDNLQYIWEEGDRINIWSNTGTLLIYKVEEITEEGTRAKFSGGGFTLTDGETYYSSHPLILSVLDDYKTLTTTYEGETQTANNDARHIASYTYTYASAICTNGNTSFQYHHLSSFIKFNVTLPKALTLTELTLTADSPVFALNGKADVTTGSFTAGDMSDVMTLKLDDIQVSDVLKASLAVAPYAAGKFVVRVKDSEGVVYSSAEITKGALAVGSGTIFNVEVFEGENPPVAKIGDVVYPSLAEAVAAVPTDGTETTITMIGNDAVNVVGSALTIAATKNIILDLNGHQVVGTATEGSTSALITNKGTLTIKDSSDANADGTGSGQLISGATNTWIYNGDGNYAGSYASNTITNTGVLTIESGYVENLSTGSATYAVDNNSSGADAVLNMNGGILKAHSVAVREFANSTAKVNTINVTGGTITAGYSGIWIQLPGSDATKAMKAALNVSGGTIEGGSYAFYDYSYGNLFDATLYTLTGGTFDGDIFSYGANIAISGGTFNGDVAIKQSKPSSVSVSGGKFAGDVYTYGDNASEGFITGGVYAINTYEYQGTTYDCDWLGCIADGYIAGDNTDPATMSDYPYAVVVDTNVYVAKIGGTKYLTLAAAIAAVQDGQTITLLDNITLTEDLAWNTEGDATFTLNLGEYKITKGNFSIKLKLGQAVNTSKSSDVFTTDDAGYYVKRTSNTDGTYTYTVEEADLMLTTSNGTVSYKPWSNTIISNSGTYKLIKDVTTSARIVPGVMATNVTLDLNGHTLTSTATDWAIYLSRNGSASAPKTFDLVDNSVNGGGKLIVNENADAAIQATGKYNNVTIGENVTIDGGCVAMLSENQNLIVNGTINGGNDFAVATNGSSTKNTTIAINEGAVLTSNVAAMYLPGNEGVVTTVNGATITGGDAGVEIRAGQLIVNSGNISSTATAYSYVPNDNGTTTKGTAIAVVQHNTVLPIDVQVLDGTLTGLNQIAVVDAQENNLEGVSVTAKDDLVATTVIPAGFMWVSDGSMSTLSRIPNAAQIGETEYATLQDALDAAHEMTGNVTITLIANITGYSIVHQKDGLNVTIDGAQKTVDGQIIIDGDGRASGTETLTISNIKFQGDKTNFCTGTDSFILIPSTKESSTPYYTGKYNYAHNITVSNCSFNSTSSTLNVVGNKANSGAGAYNYVITGCTGSNLHSLAQLTGTTGGAVTNNTVSASESFVNVNGGTGTFDVSGNTFTTTEGSDGYGIRENGGSTAVLNLSDNNFTAFNSIKLGKGASATNGTINISSGTYNGTIVKDIAATATGKIVITGGSFDVEPNSEFIADGYKAVEENGRWVIVEKLPEAKIGGVEYATLQAALDAAHEMSGDVTITLIADATGYSIVHQKDGLNVTIDGAQKTVDGQIIIDGDGRASGTETLTISNIKFQGDNTNFVAGTDAFILVPSTKETDPYTTGKYNYAHNITVSNCSFTSTSSTLNVVGNKANSGAGAYNYVITGCTGTNLHSLAQLTGTTGGAITNNTVSSSESFVNISGGTGTFAISGNTFTTTEGSDGYGIRENSSSTAVLNLSDNNFTAFNSIKLGKSASATNGTINITSGTYNGTIVKDIAASATGKIVITGGTFSVDPSAFVVAGYHVEGNSPYTVVAD